MKNKIVISAYATFPYEKSSEGIVNKNWIDILKKNNHVIVINSNLTAKSEKKISDFCEDNFLKNLKKNVKKKRGFYSFIYKVLNKIFYLVISKNKSLSLYCYIWVKRQSFFLKKADCIDETTIFWVRVLPTFSIEPVLNLYKKRKIPIIININDPIENQQYASSLLSESINATQCWTFPSYSLAQDFSRKYKLDIKRCFVIPHAMKEQRDLYEKSFNKSKLEFMYTGTFYKGAFTDSFMKQLRMFKDLELSNYVEFTFILSQYNDESIELLKNTIPNVKILKNLERDEVLTMLQHADCMLVVDAINHTTLLKGKLIEAISFGIPIFSVSYRNSVMDKVVTEYGGFSSYQEEENNIFESLIDAVKKLKNEEWNHDFLKKRISVMKKISEENILKLTYEINSYALERFNFFNNKSRELPKEPNLPKWP